MWYNAVYRYASFSQILVSSFPGIMLSIADVHNILCQNVKTHNVLTGENTAVVYCEMSNTTLGKLNKVETAMVRIQEAVTKSQKNRAMKYK
jgi:hypothetical protein